LTDNPKAPGAYSLAEILSQPQCWSACLSQSRESGELKRVRERFLDAQEWLFVGCGSSYYVALSAAATFRLLTGRAARAVPASDVLLYPEMILEAGRKTAPVLISRSGQTSEILRTADLLNSRGIPALAISCAAGQPLEKKASTAIVLAGAEERSTVMTRSFTSMLLLLQALAAEVAGRAEFSGALADMAESVVDALEGLPERIGEFVSGHRFEDYVCLGQGPFYGLACECALKTTEMSVSYAQSFHTLEFRHGPKSIVSPETLLVFLLSETGYEAEREVLEEMKALGATTLVIANRADHRVRDAADLLVEFSLDVPELLRLACYLFPAQLLGLYTGLQKGGDPDEPRNLSRVVVLNS
jgi:glutamine---fructose-6-phosphate transaminase (isomerizing)